ncbi:hypothetical protein PN488_00665 [Nodularia spumigena CS-591/12]|uniref:hypothetical protein n=1 Tax=Nodularia spumigena TaxID=70799 RepID=UPI00232AFE5B|nr:hypothetical protein [Nodularia spumigena]MDB9302908.1 hypothetical protein [Nodularia spumigena CS-591/12]MDB9345098.1 hypothetical protein [Nodularia spumigena CS-588/06]MDB9369377.1 hypothetical protein [Nodularia spumigena CS-586/05]
MNLISLSGDNSLFFCFFLPMSFFEKIYLLVSLKIPLAIALSIIALVKQGIFATDI